MLLPREENVQRRAVSSPLHVLHATVAVVQQLHVHEHQRVSRRQLLLLRELQLQPIRHKRSVLHQGRPIIQNGVVSLKLADYYIVFQQL